MAAPVGLCLILQNSFFTVEAANEPLIPSLKAMHVGVEMPAGSIVCRKVRIRASQKVWAETVFGDSLQEVLCTKSPVPSPNVLA